MRGSKNLLVAPCALSALVGAANSETVTQFECGSCFGGSTNATTLLFDDDGHDGELVRLQYREEDEPLRQRPLAHEGALERLFSHGVRQPLPSTISLIFLDMLMFHFQKIFRK
jgi:hypothetical protein